MVGKKLPDGWKLVKFKKVAEIDNRTISPDEMKGKFQNYIGLENIESNTGQLVNFSETLGDDIKSNKFQFTEEHILYGKLRPYLNKVYLPDFAGVCSTDIIPIKPDSDLLIREFLGYFLRTPEFVSTINTKATGANLPRVNPNALLDVYIPLPPLDTQHQIVAILDKAEATQRLRAEADALMQNLLQSVFDEMFGDPISNPKGWPRVTLEDLSLEIVDCPHSTPKYTEDCTLYPCIRTTELKDGFIDWSVMKYVEDQEYKERTKRLVPKEGDVIYGREGSFGVAVRVPKGVNICLGQRTMLFRPNLELCESEFLWALINSKGLYQQALKKTSGSTVGHINVKDVKQFVGFRPPLQLQKTFTDIVKKIDETMSYQKSSDRSISVLLESINAKAFTGDLVA